MIKFLINPRYANAEFEEVFVKKDGSRLDVPYLNRYNSAEDGQAKINAIPIYIVREFNDDGTINKEYEAPY